MEIDLERLKERAKNSTKRSDIYRCLDAMSERIDELEVENEELKKENERLREENSLLRVRSIRDIAGK